MTNGSERMKYFVKEWVVPVLVALLIVILLNKFVFILVTVPTGSMENTIMPGDRLYVNKIFNIDDAKRGDIIVFKSIELGDKRLVKRLIGMPGDMVDINADGTVYVNGDRLQEDYTIKSTGIPKTYSVPEDSYLFLGDNRPISYDARYWDNPYINREQIIGKAVFRFWPLNRIGTIK